jgi:hypothetical protein
MIEIAVGLPVIAAALGAFWLIGSRVVRAMDGSVVVSGEHGLKTFVGFATTVGVGLVGFVGYWVGREILGSL